MVNTVWVNADEGRDLHPLADHVTIKKISPRKNVFTSVNVIVCLMISQNLHTKVAQMN